MTRDEADAGNQRLSDALIQGLDEQCEVGMGGTFYYFRERPVGRVTTWTGDLVSDDAQVRGDTITFRRHGMLSLGRLPRDSDAFPFRRVS